MTLKTYFDMNIFRVNTTAFEEEDFYLLTDLTEDDIVEVVIPLVNAERDGEDFYDNDKILSYLKKRYPRNNVTLFNEFHTITI